MRRHFSSMAAELPSSTTEALGVLASAAVSIDAYKAVSVHLVYRRAPAPPSRISSPRLPGCPSTTHHWCPTPIICPARRWPNTPILSCAGCAVLQTIVGLKWRLSGPAQYATWATVHEHGASRSGARTVYARVDGDPDIRSFLTPRHPADPLAANITRPMSRLPLFVLAVGGLRRPPHLPSPF